MLEGLKAFAVLHGRVHVQQCRQLQRYVIEERNCVAPSLSVCTSVFSGEAPRHGGKMCEAVDKSEAT